MRLQHNQQMQALNRAMTQIEDINTTAGELVAADAVKWWQRLAQKQLHTGIAASKHTAVSPYGCLLRSM
jgi:hypothetical protein